MKTRTQIAFGSYQWMLIYVGKEKNETQDAFVTTLSKDDALFLLRHSSILFIS